MAETVTGYLRTFGGFPIGAKQPKLYFTARQAAVGGSSLLITDPLPAPPDPTTGAWTVQLVASMSTIPETVYDVSAEWLDPNFYGEGVGLSRRDVLQGLRVPVGGGDILDLIKGGSGPGMLWIETNDSIDPQGSNPGDLVLNPTTGFITIVI